MQRRIGVRRAATLLPNLPVGLPAMAGRPTIAAMPIKSIVMAVVLSGWLIAAVVAFMIVAYASFFGIAVVGIVIWFVSARMDLEQDGAGAVGVGISPASLPSRSRPRRRCR